MTSPQRMSKQLKPKGRHGCGLFDAVAIVVHARHGCCGRVLLHVVVVVDVAQAAGVVDAML